MSIFTKQPVLHSCRASGSSLMKSLTLIQSFEYVKSFFTSEAEAAETPEVLQQKLLELRNEFSEERSPAPVLINFLASSSLLLRS